MDQIGQGIRKILVFWCISGRVSINVWSKCILTVNILIGNFSSKLLWTLEFYMIFGQKGTLPTRITLTQGSGLRILKDIDTFGICLQMVRFSLCDSGCDCKGFLQRGLPPFYSECPGMHFLRSRTYGILQDSIIEEAQSFCMHPSR